MTPALDPYSDHCICVRMAHRMCLFCRVRQRKERSEITMTILRGLPLEAGVLVR